MSAIGAGSVIDRYLVEAEVGNGGMATVYRVRHQSLGTVHALKVLHLRSPSVQERLLHEGRIQARLHHPNIVGVTDVIDVDGSPGLVMEYVGGPTLDLWLAGRRPPLGLVEALFNGIVDGVEHAHQHGLVHRDLKPGNVLLDKGDDGFVPKVADFGLVKALDGEGSMTTTMSGIALGTPAYMAPEQIVSARDVDARADIFALGCVLYELITGTTAFVGDNVLATMTAVSEGTFVDPREYVPGLPERFRHAIYGCLAVDRETRIRDCEELREVLAGHQPWAGMPVPKSNAPRLWFVLAVAAGVLLTTSAAAAIGVAAWVTRQPEEPVLIEAPVVAAEAPPVAAPAPIVQAPVEAPRPKPKATPVVATVVPPPPLEIEPSAPEPVEDSPAIGEVRVVGDARNVRLSNNGSVRAPGALAAGTWTIHADFDGNPNVPVGRVTVPAGGTVTLDCSADFLMCRAR